MSRCLLELCLWAALLWAAVEGRPTSVEQLPDGTDVMLSSMGLVEGTDRQHELQSAPHPDWQRPAAGAAGLRLDSDLDTENGLSVEGAVLRQLLQRLLSPPAPLLQSARQRRGGSGRAASGGGGAQGYRQHQQLTRQLLRRFEDLQKRSKTFNRELLRQARGYMCLSKVCNFKGARGK